MSKTKTAAAPPPIPPHQQQQQHPHRNVINSIMSFLPDNRPVTALQIVEDYERCPKNFFPINRTYDQDADADLWRETNILFGKRTGRYLCLSKSEGIQDYIVETLKVIADKEIPPMGFSILSRSADTEQKAWRKKQIAYKLSKRSDVNQAITDVILCSKLKTAPEGFTLAGDINGILVCFKLGVIDRRPLGLVQQTERQLNSLHLSPKPPATNLNDDHDYEEISTSYQISPLRPAPKPPVVTASCGTLSGHTEVEGVPFMLNPNLSQNAVQNIPELTNFKPITVNIDYDFQLERQILCTTKTTNVKHTNPFFH